MSLSALFAPAGNTNMPGTGSLPAVSSCMR